MVRLIYLSFCSVFNCLDVSGRTISLCSRGTLNDSLPHIFVLLLFLLAAGGVQWGWLSYEMISQFFMLLPCLNTLNGLRRHPGQEGSNT